MLRSRRRNEKLAMATRAVANPQLGNAKQSRGVADGQNRRDGEREDAREGQRGRLRGGHGGDQQRHGQSHGDPLDQPAHDAPSFRRQCNPAATTVYGMGTKRGLERIIFFTDAVVAIAITLLILPLVDLAPHTHSVEQLFTDHWDEIEGFVISFAVIARMWVAHHSIFEHVDGYNWVLLLESLIWTFTIVLLPLPTVMTSVVRPSVASIAFYVGTMTVSSIMLTVITWTVSRNPKLESTTNPVSNRMRAGSITTTGAFVVALNLGTVFPVLTYWPLLLLALTGPVDAAVARWFTRRDALRHHH
jgi:uncharacterized membrane protein